MTTKANKGDVINSIPFGNVLVKRRFLDKKGTRWYEVFHDKNPHSTFDVQEKLCNRIVKRLVIKDKEPF